MRCAVTLLLASSCIGSSSAPDPPKTAGKRGNLAVPAQDGLMADKLSDHP